MLTHKRFAKRVTSAATTAREPAAATTAREPAAAIAREPSAAIAREPAAAKRSVAVSASYSVPPTPELVNHFERAMLELHPPVTVRQTRIQRRFQGPMVVYDMHADHTTLNAVAAAVYALLGPGRACAVTAGMARARTTLASDTSSAPYMNTLVANARDLLSVSEHDVAKIHAHLVGVARYSVGVTPAGDLAFGIESVTELRDVMLQTNAIVDGSQMIEMVDDRLMTNMVVGAVQSSCAAYVHARAPARASADIVINHLSTRVSTTIDWNSKIQQAADNHRVAFLADNVVAVL